MDAQDALGNRGVLRLLRQRRGVGPAGAGEREQAANAAAERAMRQAPAGSHGSRSDRSLPAATRAWLERAYGASLAGFRIHADTAGARRAAGERAQAVTDGPDLHFGAGRYAPHTRDGQRLIAHEVAHAIQQRTAGERTVQHQPDDKIDANQVFPFAKGTKLVQASTTTEKRLGEVEGLARLAEKVGGMTPDELEGAVRGLDQIRSFAPIDQSFTLVVKESSADAVIAEQDPKTVAAGATPRRLELRRLEGNRFELATESQHFETTPQKQDGGGWLLPSILEGREVQFNISPPGDGDARRITVTVSGQEIDVIEVTPLAADESAKEVAEKSFREAQQRARPELASVSGGIGFALPTSVRDQGQPLAVFSLRRRFFPFAGTQVLSFPVGFDVGSWIASEDDFAFLVSPRFGIEFSEHKGGAYFNLQTGLTFGALPNLPSPDDPTRESRTVLGIDALVGWGMNLGPTRLDFLTGWTGGVTDESPSFLTMFLVLGSRRK